MKFRHRLLRPAAIGLATVLALSACAAEETPDPDTDAEDVDDDGEEPAAAGDPGLDGCEDRPLTCNEGEREDGGEIVWMINQGHDAVYNHHRPEGGSVYLFQMLEGIMPSTGQFLPDGEWEWNLDLFEEEPEIVNEDPQTMVYRIRDEAQWNDGTPIDVDDFRWIWYHNSGNEDHCVGCNPRATSGWDEVASIEGEDDGKTVTITLNDGIADPEWFARYELTYPAHASGEDIETPEGMGASSEYFLNTVPDWTAGPYLVESWTADESVVMVPNDNWYGSEQPTLDTLSKVIISDQGSWLPAMQNREIDGASPASFFVDLIGELDALPGVYHGTGSAGAVWDHVDINMDSITDVALRQAIFTAIDTEDAISRIFGGIVDPPQRLNHIFDQGSPYFEDKLTDTGYGTGDVDAALAILEDAGYTLDGDTLMDPDGNAVPPLRFAWLDGNENRATFVELSQSYLADIGIEIEPQATPGDQLGTVLEGQDFDLVIFGWSGSPLFTSSPHQFYNSESGSNFGKLTNDELDTLTEEVRNQIDIADSAVLANQAVEIVMDEAYSLPLWDTLNLMFVSDEFANIRDNHNSSLRSLYNLEAWGVLAVN
jgi:peptide/nickel transport system substrate-binding protein